jgi:hypothetical protein
MERNFSASWEVVPSTDVGYSSLVADNDNLDSAFNGMAVLATGRRSAASSGLREDDLADAVADPNGAAHLSEDAGHFSVLRCENALAREEHLEEACPKERSSANATEYGQKENQRSDEDAEVV